MCSIYTNQTSNYHTGQDDQTRVIKLRSDHKNDDDNAHNWY